MVTFARTDTSVVGHWWWAVDRWAIAALISLVAIGAVLAPAASPPMAERLGFDTFYFARRQIAFLGIGIVVMLAVSFLSARGIQRLAVVCTATSIALMVATLNFGDEIKGATRWLYVGGLSMQPSEFVKPGFAVIAAWLFAAQRLDSKVPGYAVATALFALVTGLLLLQPDVGMAMVVAVVWGTQFFVAGLPLILVLAIALVFIAGSVAAYFVFDHVQARVDQFFDPAAGEKGQVERALDAFQNGGWAGRGPGEGRVKEALPEAHADFIFAVVGEEFGLIACLIVVGLFAFVLLRGFNRVFRNDNLFVLLAVTGLLVQFAVQAIINLASTVNLIPPKGMTLPFLSYGGSSTIALALSMGMMLALTREAPAPRGGRS